MYCYSHTNTLVFGAIAIFHRHMYNLFRVKHCLSQIHGLIGYGNSKQFPEVLATTLKYFELGNFPNFSELSKSIRDLKSFLNFPKSSKCFRCSRSLPKTVVYVL